MQERDAQAVKPRHLADVDRNGPTYLQGPQFSASVRRVDVRREETKGAVNRVGGEEPQERAQASVSEEEGGGAAARKREEEERCARGKNVRSTHSALKPSTEP